LLGKGSLRGFGKLYSPEQHTMPHDSCLMAIALDNPSCELPGVIRRADRWDTRDLYSACRAEDLDLLAGFARLPVANLV
jgi:hypothetical protein